MNMQILQQLQAAYPIYMPVGVAAELLGVSQRQLSHLIAEGREPFCSFGVNIGLNGQRYAKIYTMRLLRYLTGDDMNIHP